MADKKVLLVGLDPALVDYAHFPGLDEGKVLAGIRSDEARLRALGYDAKWCLVDRVETAEAVVRERLRRERYDCILVGAGVRTDPGKLALFERLINVLHQQAPQAKLCFNTKPSDTAEAVQRWL